MTDREAIELIAFFFAVVVACQMWLAVKKPRGNGGE